MRNILHFRFIPLLIFVMAAATFTWGQLNTGSISGVVSDPSGAVVPNAKVILTDAGKGFKFEAVTDAAGRYTFRSLQPSVYSVSVQATGFKKYSTENITLNVNQNLAEDVHLAVGEVNETIVVNEAGVEKVNVEDAATGQTIDRKLINDLPLVGRNVFDLTYLAPGVSNATGKTFSADNVYANNFVSQGTRNAQSDVLLDGVSTTNYEQNTGFVLPLYQPPVDAVQEFKVQQTNFSAEYGFTGAVVTNVVMRSGTNNFHGGLYEFWRNDLLNANDYFNIQHNVARPAYRWNDFGGTIGGPVIKNKLFFFFDYEGNRNVTYQNGTFGLPTKAERGGNFGELCTLPVAQGGQGSSFDNTGKCLAAAGQIWDPYSINTAAGVSSHQSTAFVPFNNLATYTSPNNLGVAWIGAGPGNLINPVAQNILKYIPFPNIANAKLSQNFFGEGGQHGAGNKYDARGDYRPTDNDLVALRVSHQWTNSQNGANLLGTNFDANTQGIGQGNVWQGAVNYNHTFSPRTILAASLGYSHSWSHTFGIDPNFDPTSIGLPAYNTASGFKAPPDISIDGYAGENGNANFGGQPWSGLLYGQDVQQLIASVSHITGSHDLKVGGEIRRHTENFTQYGLPAGRWQFQSGWTAQDANNSAAVCGGACGGDAMASFITGFASGWNAYEIPPSPATQNFQYAGFVQDNWHVNDRLTLNLGFRYDVDLPRTERYDRMSYFDPKAPAPWVSKGFSVAPSAGCPFCNNLGSLEYVGNGNPKSPFNAYYGGYGPRLGFAYRLDDKTSVRGGFGIYYDPSKGGAAGSGSGAAGFAGYDQQTTFTTYTSCSNNCGNGNNIAPSSQSVLGLNAKPNPVTGKANGVFTDLGSTVSGVPVRTFNVLPREYSWSFGFQRELPGQVIVEASYVGKKGENLYFGGDTYALSHLSDAVAAQFRANPAQWQGFVNMPTDIKNAIQGVTPAWSNPAWQGTWPMYMGYLPYPQYFNGPWGTGGLQNTDPPIASSIYHGFELRLERRFSQGLQFLVSYTNQKSLDNASIAGNNVWVNGIAGATLASVQDPNCLRCERSLSQFDVSQIISSAFVYQLPYGRGRTWGGSANGVVNGILGGWQISGNYRWDTGQPLLLGTGATNTVPTWGVSRANLDGSLQRSSSWKDAANGTGNYFTNAALVISRPAPFFPGNAPRVLPNVRAPGTNNLALAVFKDFPLSFREGMSLQLRAETFNTFNHVQFCAPNMGLSWDSANFFSTSGNFGTITCQANAPRQMQLGLKFNF